MIGEDPEVAHLAAEFVRTFTFGLWGIVCGSVGRIAVRGFVWMHCVCVVSLVDGATLGDEWGNYEQHV